MELLPAELVELMCIFLPKPSLKAFRLTCQAYANIGEVQLFRDFEFRLYPNHHRLYQLEQLSRHPTIAQKLRCLSLESGVQLEYADYRYWQAQMYQVASTRWASDLASQGSAHEDYEQFHAALQARFTTHMSTTYDLYRWHLDQEAAMMAKGRVQNKLRQIMNALHASGADFEIKIMMVEPRITLDDLEKFDSSTHSIESTTDPDPRRRVSNRRHNCLTHFINFLEASQLSDCRVSGFTAIDIPHQMLTIDSIHGSDVLDETFLDLKKVDLKISQFPHSDWLSRGGIDEIYFGGRNLAANRLARLLRIPVSMESLRLEFPEGKEAEYSFDIFDRTNIDRFPRHWLPRLKDLSFNRFRCTWEDLQALLGDAKEVTSLTLSHCRLETGSMVDLVRFLPQIKLAKIRIEGRWYVDQDAGEWHSHGIENFTDCFAATSYEGPYAASGVRYHIESYILSKPGASCPLPKLTPEGNEDRIWEREGDTSWHYLPGISPT